METLTTLLNQFVVGVFKVHANGGQISTMTKVGALHQAIEADCLRDVSALVEDDAEVNVIYMQETAFTKAVDIEHYKAADIIMKSKSFDPNAGNQFDRTPLFMAAKNGQTQFVEKLLEMGAEVNTADVRGVTPLGACGWHDSHEAAELLISHGANINQADRFGETPLFRACSNVSRNVVKVLIAHKCDVNQANREMKTPLMAALPTSYNTQIFHKKISTSLSICEMLIQAGCDLNSQDAMGKTALHHAVDNDDIYSLCVLAENGCKLDVPGGDGYTPFVNAIMPTRPHYELARYLLYYGADPNQTLKSPFDDKQAMSPLSLLLSDSAEVKSQADKWSRALLLLALRGTVYPDKGVVQPDSRTTSGGNDLPFPDAVDRDLLSWLKSDVPCSLQHQARLSIRDSLGYKNVMPKINTLSVGSALKQYLNLGLHPESIPLSKLCHLHLSIEDGLNEKVKEIVASGVDVNVYINNKTPLALALEVGNMEAASVILKSEPKPRTKMMNAFQESALHIVAQHGRMAVLEEVLSLSENIEAKDVDGRTPLQRAIKAGHFDVATVLINKGADIRCQEGDPTPFIHLAAAYGNVDFVKLLLEKGVDPNSVDKFGNTPLHVAATRGADYLRRFVALPGLYNDSIAANLDAVQMMLTDGEPRYIKTTTGHASVIECLLKHGADPKKVDGQNQTPLERARRGQAADVMHMLHGRPRIN